ncbi:MAG: hypothetical protein LBC13_02215 [Clostridiales bacterium]|jgi:hypothetical protein|nr:hypothetical protein [Clostridiales bacterium]
MEPVTKGERPQKLRVRYTRCERAITTASKKRRRKKIKKAHNWRRCGSVIKTVDKEAAEPEKRIFNVVATAP